MPATSAILLALLMVVLSADGVDSYTYVQKYTYFSSNNKLTKYPDGFCGGQPFDTCDWGSYGEALLLLSMVTLMIAAILFIIILIFWIGRKACFGGCHASDGFCCPGTRFNHQFEKGYSNCQVCSLRVVVVILVACSIPLFIVSIHGNVLTTDQLHTIGHKLVTKADDTYNRYMNIYNKMNSTDFQRFEAYSSEETKQKLDDELNQIMDDLLNVQSDAHLVNDKSERYNHYRYIATMIILSFGMLACVFLFISIFNCHRLSAASAVLLVFLIPLMWILFSVHYSGNFMVSDLCTTYSDRYNNGTAVSNYTNPIIQEAFNGCKNDTMVIPLFSEMVTTVDDMFNSTFSQACGDHGIGHLCNVQFDYYPNGYEQPSEKISVMDCSKMPHCDNTTVVLYLRAPVTDFLVGCYNSALKSLDCPFSSGNSPDICQNTGGKVVSCKVQHIASVDACQHDCVNPQIRNTSIAAVEGITSLLRIKALWEHEALPLINCSNLLPFINDIEDSLCDKEYNNVQRLVAPNLFVCNLVTWSWCCRSARYEEVPQEEST
ncbi:hypothetical protein SAMD00019534_016710 [Acytostelium subglobosum LB1]|uniref:hypothetical protein n=1 Tax=Acytostelium subglobosum LB1 TaxID=1410327 RepID=UPI000645076F|nr:hypothetical protein SAMD00019534_016710 [Acytostelium subglobosum LB1]GAM18496.1 hypothetical protein SAMD00019534_016710 [Acytostelium subglobosum LB1]|eukprot:XP_012757716.1 hypothetical protein SAMD00019534_016710 [Acytostelium subglobosum LB1]